MAGEKSRECTVFVRAEQTDRAGEEEKIETRCKGRLSMRGGVLYVLYEEIMEETVVKNLLKIAEDPPRVSLKKSGGVSWDMHFEAGKSGRSEYRTPCGALEIGARTEDVTLRREQEKTSLQLRYTLFIQGEKQADCRLEIEVV